MVVVLVALKVEQLASQMDAWLAAFLAALKGGMKVGKKAGRMADPMVAKMVAWWVKMMAASKDLLMAECLVDLTEPLVVVQKVGRMVESWGDSMVGEKVGKMVEMMVGKSADAKAATSAGK